MTELAFERAFRKWCGEEGMRWRTFRYPRSTGGEAEAHVLSPAGGTRGRVLVVHGAGNDALFSFSRLFASLLERGMEVLTFDVDGHGRNSTTILTPEGAATAVPAALAAFGHDGSLPTHAVGVSLGGSLLLHAISKVDPPLATASLLSAPLRVRLSWRTLRGEIGLPMLRTLWRERDRFGLTGLVPSFGPFRRNLYPLRLADVPPPGSFGYVEVLNSILDRLDLLTAAREAEGVPVLLVYGERDRLVPPEQGVRLAESLLDSELSVLPKETHLSAPVSPAAREHLLGWIGRHRAAAGGALA